jgi:hypothetical protein
MVRYMQNLARQFRDHYAPSEWKKKTRNWDVDKALSNALSTINKNSVLSDKQFHKVVRDFANSVGDYHVSARFFSSEKATLPFTVKGNGKKLFVVHVNKALAPNFPLQVGDEIVSFNGKSAMEAVADLQKTLGKNAPETDRGLAELYITQRAGSRGQDVPKGDVAVSIKRDGKVTSHKLRWDYTPDGVGGSNLTPNTTAQSPLAQFGVMQAAFADKDMAITGDKNPFALGAKKGFVPKLGEVVWESGDNSRLHAYVFKMPNGKKVGYLRIPHYMAGQAELLEMMMLVIRFNLQTEGLVIDQTNNPGGSVAYLYGLASMLTDKILYTPRHRMSISQREAANAKGLLDISDGQFAQMAGTAIPAELLESLRDNAGFILDEWERLSAEKKKNPETQMLTKGYHLGLGDFIAPGMLRYTKPLMVLTNHLDFSGGDFFPAIMQDNKRATIFGTRTSGAGGYVQMLDAGPNLLGVQGVSITGSVAERIDNSKIESDGVKPDKEYAFTENDLRNKFADYKAAVLAEMQQILDTNKKA